MNMDFTIIDSHHVSVQAFVFKDNFRKAGDGGFPAIVFFPGFLPSCIPDFISSASHKRL